MANNTYTIKEEANVIDDNALEVIGATFNFDHVKGMSEWLKNSVDAYRRARIADKEQAVYFRFDDRTKGGAIIECIDFNGMSENDIEKALKRWFDPEASKRGLRNLKTYGGHGNGGKFYMRQMFDTSYFITYKDGLLNVFGFSENKKYGFADGYRNKKLNPEEALKYAGLDKPYIASEIKNRVKEGKTGFTVVRGIKPATMPNSLRVKYLINQLVSFPQSQRILVRITSKVIYNDEVLFDKLQPELLTPLTSFEHVEPIPVPETLVYETHHDRVVIQMRDNKYPAGVLRLSTSEQPLTKNSKNGELNRIDVLGELGVIGSYKIHELGTAALLPQSVFIYGELECPILEKPGSDCVQNDRSKLIENPTTKALLEWVNSQIVELCKKIGEKERKEREEKMKDISSSLNNYLNDWKDKFMSKILSEVFVGTGNKVGQGTGGSSGGGGGSDTSGDSDVDTPGGGGDGDGAGVGSGTGGSGDDDSKGGGDTPKKSKRSPRVLLSDQDADPFDPDGESITLSPRQPAVYQRQQDVDEGIYWINTSAPLAKSILERYAQEDPRWRDYLFQRYVDIFVREALTTFERRDPDEFNAANVETKINEIITKIHEAAATELSSFLFEEQFKAVDENGRQSS